jgi:hypothetical protein
MSEAVLWAGGVVGVEVGVGDVAVVMLSFDMTTKMGRGEQLYD